MRDVHHGEQGPWQPNSAGSAPASRSKNSGAGAGVGDLVLRQHLAASTVSGLIGQMITSDPVVREVDPADRRASVVTLTDAGHEARRLGTGGAA